MCCAIAALVVSLLVGGRSLSRKFLACSRRLRWIAIAFIAIGAAAGSAFAAGQFGDALGGQPDVETTPNTMPICGRLIRVASVFALSHAAEEHPRSNGRAPAESR
jgi:hypothetical protein